MVSIQEDKQVYLLFGEEQWLKNQYIKDLKGLFSPQGEDLMNHLSLEGKEATFSSLEDFCETMPFFVSHKTIFLKNTGLFKAGRKEDTEKIALFLKKLPDYVIVIFQENEVDKRNKLYKWIHKEQQAISCEYLEQNEILVVLQKYCKEEKIKIAKKELLYFVQNMSKSIETMFLELQKMKAYAGQEAITIKMIDKLCTFNIEQVVFQLLDEMIQKNTTKALGIYKKLMERKESPIGVLVLIARQYRMILQTKYLMRKGEDSRSIGKKIGLPYFVVNKTQEQARHLSFSFLQTVLGWCLETDEKIKTGKQEPRSAVELLIVKCIHQGENL